MNEKEELNNELRELNSHLEVRNIQPKTANFL